MHDRQVGAGIAGPGSAGTACVNRLGIMHQLIYGYFLQDEGITFCSFLATWVLINQRSACSLAGLQAHQTKRCVLKSFVGFGAHLIQACSLSHLSPDTVRGHRWAE